MIKKTIGQGKRRKKPSHLGRPTSRQPNRKNLPIKHRAWPTTPVPGASHMRSHTRSQNAAKGKTQRRADGNLPESPVTTALHRAHTSQANAPRASTMSKPCTLAKRTPAQSHSEGQVPRSTGSATPDAISSSCTEVCTQPEGLSLLLLQLAQGRGTSQASHL